MDHFAGLDVSVKDTSVCIVDGAGKIVREVKVASEPDSLLQVLSNPATNRWKSGIFVGLVDQAHGLHAIMHADATAAHCARPRCPPTNLGSRGRCRLAAVARSAFSSASGAKHLATIKTHPQPRR
jgi:hypothetical protein